MNIDERLEAITLSLELLARMHLDDDKVYQQRFAENEKRLAQLMDSMNRLVNIVEAHENRLDNLEGH